MNLDQLLDISYEQLMQVYSDSHRWHLNCGLWQKQHSLLKGLRKVKKEVPPMEKPEDPPAGLDHPAREGRQHGECIQ